VVESREGQPQLDHRLNPEAAGVAAEDAVLIAVLTFAVLESDACKHFDSEAVIDELGMSMQKTTHHPDSKRTASAKQHVPDIAVIFPFNVPSDVARELTMPRQQRLSRFLSARLVLLVGWLLIGLLSDQGVAVSVAFTSAFPDGHRTDPHALGLQRRWLSWQSDRAEWFSTLSARL
jgi:hypothetical protein